MDVFQRVVRGRFMVPCCPCYWDFLASLAPLFLPKHVAVTVIFGFFETKKYKNDFFHQKLNGTLPRGPFTGSCWRFLGFFEILMKSS